MNKLPKVSNKPLFRMKIPSQNREVVSRPFVVREEKLLLTAQQSGDDKDIILALKQILALCIQDEGFDPDSLATFDLEYMFLKLRARSVNNIIKVSYQDIDDGLVYDFTIDLDEVEMLQTKEFNNKIMLSDEVGVVMKYPSITILDEMSEELTPVETVEYLIIKCIDQVFDLENVYPSSEYTDAELKEFIDDLDSESFDKIKGFFDSLPELYHKLEYTNANGDKKTIELTTLNDFFIWR